MVNYKENKISCTNCKEEVIARELKNKIVAYCAVCGMLEIKLLNKKVKEEEEA